MLNSKIPHVEILLLNWENAEDTIHCLETLKSLAYGSYHVLVVDNGSKDNSYSLLKETVSHEPYFTLYSTGENLGFSGGVNYGIKKALQSEADYIWLLNNDTEVASDCLSQLILAIDDDPEVGIAGSKILLASDRNTIWHAGASFDKWTGQPKHVGMGYSTTQEGYNELKSVDYITGCSLLIRSSMLKTVGLMDEKFYLYYEEADFCYRAKKKGWKIIYVPDSILWHKVAGSSKGYHQRAYYEVRNRLLFTLKHRPIFILPVLCYLLYKEVILKLAKGENQVFCASYLGMIDFIRGKYGRASHQF
ncbi:MAG: glycosyltransferase family 2 protein [Aphanocapsa sp. GSE-SYN-MK-11-07L]|jgi:hypothetical protein|nr:glycosyltransferase family 2 protein [Aphanocapsa sp. GSE-SYN-MK-11-07L]